MYLLDDYRQLHVGRVMDRHGLVPDFYPGAVDRIGERSSSTAGRSCREEQKEREEMEEVFHSLVIRFTRF